MQWERASMPVAAVSQGGRPSVSSGSQMARFGIRFGLMMPSLRPSARFMTEPRPTSCEKPCSNRGAQLRTLPGFARAKMVYGSALSNSTSVNAVGVAVSARHVAREVPEEAELDRKTIDILDFVACEAEGRRQLGALLEEGGDVLTLLQRCARRQVLLQLIQLSPQTGRIRLDRLEAAHLERACSLQEPRLGCGVRCPAR